MQDRCAKVTEMNGELRQKRVNSCSIQGEYQECKLLSERLRKEF